jgi:ferrochelatase
MNLGGPTHEAAIRPFLNNLFLDPDIIKLGGGLAQRTLAGLISSRRAPKIAPRYRSINICKQGCEGHARCPMHQTGSDCCSPLNPLTEGQRRALELKLRTEMAGAGEVRVFTAMRYWHPFTEVTLAEVAAWQPTHVVHLPLYPQFSWTTTGSSLREWQRLKSALAPQAQWHEVAVKSYETHPRLVRLLANRLNEALTDLPADERAEYHIVFSAHGTPLAEVRSGDPYTHQVEATVAAVMAHTELPNSHWLSYQSRVGPAKWTQPNTEDLCLRLMDYGVRKLLVVPVAFVTDHIETVMELNIELREELEHKGLRDLRITRALNDDPEFIGALTDIVLAQMGAYLTIHSQPETANALA